MHVMKAFCATVVSLAVLEMVDGGKLTPTIPRPHTTQPTLTTTVSPPKLTKATTLKSTTLLTTTVSPPRRTQPTTLKSTTALSTGSTTTKQQPSNTSPVTGPSHPTPDSGNTAAVYRVQGTCVVLCIILSVGRITFE